MKKLAALVALFCMTAGLVSAATTIIRQDGTGDATTIEEAIAKTADGDPMEIQQWTVPFTPADTPGLSWRSLICTTPERAPIVLTKTLGMSVGNCTLKHLKLIGKMDGSVQEGVGFWGAPTLDDCEITGFGWAGFSMNSDNANDTITIKNSYFSTGSEDIECGEGLVRVGNMADGTKVVIDHCTFYGRHAGSKAIGISNGTPASYTGANITVTNCIFSNMPTAISGDSHPTLAVVEHHNDFDTWWGKPIRCNGSATEIDPHVTDIAVAPHFRGTSK